MNRDKIVDIATKLPREAYIDLLCAGAYELYQKPTMEEALLDYPNMSFNQVNELVKAFREEGKEEKHE